METQMKQSGLGIASLVLGIIGLLSSCIIIGIVPAIIGLILAIISLTQKDKKHGTAIAGLICCIISIVIFLIIMFFAAIGSGNSASQSDETKTESVVVQQTESVDEEAQRQSIEEEESKRASIDAEEQAKKESEEKQREEEQKAIEESKQKEEAEQEQQISEENFKESCQEFNYNTIARNPDEHIGENYTVTVEISQVISETSWFSDYDKYYKAWTDDGSGYYYDHLIYLMDYMEEENKVNLLEGDIVKVYGTFNGMAQTENALNNTKGEEIKLDIYYVELISE